MTFTSQLIVERSAKGSRASVKEQGKRTHALLSDGLASHMLPVPCECSQDCALLLPRVLSSLLLFVKSTEQVLKCMLPAH